MKHLIFLILLIPLFCFSQQQTGMMVLVGHDFGGGGASNVVNVSLNGVDWQPPEEMIEGWQEYREKDPGYPSGFLLYEDGSTSEYKIEIVDSGATGRASDGAQTGDDSGIVPDGALFNSLGWTSGATWFTAFKFTGLNDMLTYSIRTVSSIDRTWNWIEYSKVDGGTELYHVSDQNTTLSNFFEGRAPTEGELYVYIKGVNGWAICNAVILTEEEK